MHRKVAAALVAALALGVASCGGSEKTYTGAELVKQVEIACREAQSETQKKVDAARGRGGRTAYIDTIIEGQRNVLDKIDNINTTGAAKADFEAMKAAMQTRLDAIQRVASADRADQQRVIDAVRDDVEAATVRAKAAAARLGIRRCA